MRVKKLGVFLLLAFACTTQAMAQRATPSGASSAHELGSAPLPPGYVIGASDVLSIVFWRDKDISAEVTVRPDGKISLPLLNEIEAAGCTPEELRVKLVEAARRFIEEPDVTILVKEIRSRNVFITGQVAKPATYPLNGEMTVLQLIAIAGGVHEYADAKKIVVIRTEGGRQQSFKFNYKEVISQKNIAQNIALKPGDIVVVP